MHTLMVGKSPVLTDCSVHSHENWELIVNLSGSGIEVVGEEKHIFRPGSVTLCPPHIMHNKYLAAESNGWQDIYLRFLDITSHFPNTPIFLDDDSTHIIENLILMINNLFLQKGEDHSIIDKLSDALRTVILDRISSRLAKSALTDQINHFIIQNYTDSSCDVQNFISKMNYVNDYVRRVYKRDMHLTPGQYLLELRMEHAKKLLQLSSTPHYSIHEVALLSGFCDANYFSRQFRKFTGTTPTAYRRRYLQSSNS